jgi:hypothetical protein
MNGNIAKTDDVNPGNFWEPFWNLANEAASPITASFVRLRCYACPPVRTVRNLRQYKIAQLILLH